MFLKKVREGREDKRFERHGEDVSILLILGWRHVMYESGFADGREQIMRLDFVQRQKKWEAEQARAAHFLPLDAPEEEEEGLADQGSFGLPSPSGNAMQMSVPSWQWQATPEEADEVAQRESEELEELLSLLPGDAGSLQYEHQQQEQQSQAHQPQGHDEQMSEHYGSDDDDYDALFSDFINEEAHGMAEGGDNSHTATSGDAMDMS